MQITPHALALVRGEFPSQTAGAALRLISENGIQLFDQHDTRDGRMFQFTVITGTAAEDVNVTLLADRSIDVECSCGRPRCTHIAAGVLLALSGPATAVPAWRKELSAALPEPLADAEMCLFLSVVTPRRSRYDYRPQPSVPYLAARPGVRGSRGPWIKGNASWRHVDASRARPASERALGRIHRLWQLAQPEWYYETDWMPLADLPGGDVWPALEDLRSAGVPLISSGKAQHPVVFEDVPVDAAVTVVRHGKGLRLSAQAQQGGELVMDPDAFWIGEPPAVLARVTDPGSATERISLARLATPLSPLAHQLLRRGSALEVPAGDVTAFETEFLPRIQAGTRVVSPNGSYALPEPPRNTLVLTVQYSPPQLHLAWAWDRPAGIRDAAREASVHGAVLEAYAGHLAAHAPTAGSTAADPQALPADRTLGGASSVLFVTDVLPRLRELEGVRIVENTAPPEYRAARDAALVSAEVGGSGDWFDLHFTVTVDEEPVDFAELFTALSLDEPVFVLPSGTYFPLDGAEFATLREIIDEARALSDRPVTADAVRVNRHQLDLWNDLAELGILAAREAEWWLAVQSLADGDGVVPVDPPSTLRAELREYQATGYSWLHFLRTHGLGGILADDMGLGKTLQTIAMIETARLEAQAAGREMDPFLVVAPTSVVANWASECARFTPDLRITTISAMAGRRGEPLADAVAGAHVVLTSYALFRGEAEEYRGLQWSGLIVDEAQKIKNAASHGYRAARDLGAPFCLVLTGTPLENNLGELWALAALAAPGLLGSRPKFTEFYRTPIEKTQNTERLALLQRRLRPFLMRRTKELVATELPPKQEQVLAVELHPKHRRAYDVRFQRERQKVLGLVDDVEANRFQIFRSLMLLRQLALDPRLVDAGDAPSAKLEALEELVVEAAEEGHRVLILSQFTQFLTAARDRITAAGLGSQYLDGKTKDRAREINRFREGTDPAFFVSLQAGGFGLNLVEADYVVLLDPWWNPAVEAQAIDRAHRIGQTRPVIVYRLVAKDTIEQKVIALREAKAELFSRVLDGEGGFTPGTLTAEDVRGLLE